MIEFSTMLKDLWILKRGGLALLVGTASLLACRGSSKGGACPVGVGFGATPAVIHGEDLPHKNLSLSFDGGPNDATRTIGELLAANGVQAAFFVQGSEIEGHEDVLGSLKSAGHLVANGTYSRTPLTRAKDPVREVQKTDELIARHVSGNMFLLRAPEDEFDADVAREVEDAGLGRYVGPIGWDVAGQDDALGPDARCWQNGLGVNECLNAYVETVQRVQRGIVGLHAERSESVNLVRLLLARLKDDGYTFVRLDAVPNVRAALEKNGGVPGTVGGGAGCDDYR